MQSPCARRSDRMMHTSKVPVYADAVSWVLPSRHGVVLHARSEHRKQNPDHLTARVRAGLVFCVVTEPYLEAEYGGDYLTEAPVHLLHDLFEGFKERKDEQVVVLSQVLACDATVGYEDNSNSKVRSRASAVRRISCACGVFIQIAGAQGSSTPRSGRIRSNCFMCS